MIRATANLGGLCMAASQRLPTLFTGGTVICGG